VTPREIEEFRALRATIRERGSQRVYLFFASLVVWAASTIATAALAALPVATLLPLLLLAAGFEAIFQLHTGVERVGRYLQVFYGEMETGPVRDWERVAMAYGQAHRGGSDPLFAGYFALATLLNFVPVLLAEPVRLEVTVVGTIHLLFFVRLWIAKRAASRQRAVDLDRFQRMKDAGQTVGRPQSFNSEQGRS
jgi:hypothetical protein